MRGIQLALHFSFFLLLAVFALDGWAEAEWDGVIWYCAALLAFFACVTLHELGHSFTAMRYGVGVRRILLMPIGGMAEFDSIPRRPSHEVAIAVAGPLVNFVIAGLLWACVGVQPGGLFADSYPSTVVGFGQFLLLWNLLMGGFNLMPIFPMDGGRVFRALLASRVPYLRATRIAATTGKVFAVVAICVVLYLAGSQAALTVALFTFIIFAGEMEYRAVKRREIDDAHWRATLERMGYTEGRTEPPPVLSS